MKVSNFVLGSLLAGSIVSALPVQEKVKRLRYVTVVTTVEQDDQNAAQPLFAAPTQAAPALAANPTPAAAFFAAPTQAINIATQAAPNAAAPAAEVPAAGTGKVIAPPPINGNPGPQATQAAPNAASPATEVPAAGTGKVVAPPPINGNPSPQATAQLAQPAAAPKPATAPAAAPQVQAPKASTSSSKYSLSGLLDYLFGSSSSGSSGTTSSSGSTGTSGSSDPIDSGISSGTGIGSGSIGSGSIGSGSIGSGSGLVSSGSGSAPSSSGLVSSGYGSASPSPSSASFPGGGSTPNTAAAAASVGSKGIIYSPYTKSNACKTLSEVQSDIAKISDFEIIRLYSTDCSGIQNVLASMTSSQKLFLGVWNIDTASVQGGLSDIQKAVQSSSRGWSAVDTIAIGNERVNAGAATVSQIASALSTARSWLKSNAPGFSGSIVSVDTLVAVVANPQLCTLSDYLAVNSHPYWDGGVLPQDSGPWLENQISNLKGACGNSKAIMITETGWPNKGKNNGVCVPSIANQVVAMKSLVSSLGSQIYAFTMYNDYWKDPGPYGVESNWGVFGDPAE